MDPPPYYPPTNPTAPPPGMGFVPPPQAQAPAPYLPPKNEPTGPPAGYAYPPVPVPYHPNQNVVTQQPQHYNHHGGHGFYPLVPPPQYGIPQVPAGQVVPLNVPPGLEYLIALDSLYVKQKIELMEAFLGCETKNRYKIKDAHGRDLFTAKEDTDCCTRQCCGSIRPFDMKIKDMNGTEVILLTRPLACGSCWCPCWLQSLQVFSAGSHALLGSIEQEWSILTPKFVLKNASGDTVLRIEGPFCTYSICGDVEFQVLSKDGSTQVGKISKKWSGLAREVFTDADNFGINFPVDLDVKMKAVCLGAVFLIDFMFFEKNADGKESDGPGMF